MSDSRPRIEASAVGLSIPAVMRRVTWRQTMNYAAAVGDCNPRYFDDAAPEGIVAPPMFAVAATWPVVAGLQGVLGDAIPSSVMGRLVHASEHLTFHSPLRPGKALAIGGTVVSLVPTGAGALLTLKLQASTQDGSPVFTERVGALFRGVECDAAALSGEALTVVALAMPDARPDWEVELPVARQAAHVYDGCTDIVFPIHTSRAFALSVGLPDIILQGTATLAMAARELVDREAAGDPLRLRELSCRFACMAIPGRPIRVRAWRSGEGQVAFCVLNADGEVAVGQGRVRVAR